MVDLGSTFHNNFLRHATTFFNPQQMFLWRVKLITQGEKRETKTKTCNETMLRDKLGVFVSRIRRLKTSCIYREHTILLNRERVNKGTIRMNSLPLSPQPRSQGLFKRPWKRGCCLLLSYLMQPYRENCYSLLSKIVRSL